ncbi:MFS transporter [Sphingosinicella microcystinivorans]|uniref:MFS family arabinose efflux permease n=1 Tax=Sphingosinicella microcystinivorans TaxID=335406 RepID=A0AAD1D5D9_SPHMI|nr:MFS transporter [Sphingosinicella microcystinivorans]RKS91238.1 putative MFS family arabinose efflux permease [Sphingosinicella microcystinivorans]BBE34206.1 MFS transporter [Sphingosinicella microcystinivorans]
MQATSEFDLETAPKGVVDADRVLKGGWYTLWVMVLLVLVSNLDRQLLVLAGAPLAVSLKLTDGQLGMVQGLAVAIFAIVAVYPIAWAADRFDRRLVFGICVSVWSFGTAMCGLAQNFEHLLLAAILIAAGEAGLTPIGVAFVPELFKGRKRQLANSLFYFFIYLGVAGGLMLGGGAIALMEHLHTDLPASIQTMEPWRLAFFLVVLPTPIFLLLLAYTRLHYRSRAPVAKAEAKPRNDVLPFLRQHRRAVTAVFIGTGFFSLGSGGYMVWLPVAATRMFGTTPAQNGTMMGIATAVGLTIGVSIGTFFVRRMIPRLGVIASLRFFWIVLPCATPIFFLFPFAEANWQLFGLYGLMMVAFTAAGCAMPTIIQDLAPSHLRGRMSAIWTITTVMLSGLSPTLIGWISAALGPESRMLMVATGIIAVPAWLIAALGFRLAEKPFVLIPRDDDNDRAQAAHNAS